MTSRMVYLNPVTRDKVLIGPYFPDGRHGFKELFNGVIWEVESKMVKLFQQLIDLGMKKEEPDEPLVVDLVDRFCLFKLSKLKSEKLAEYLEHYYQLNAWYLSTKESRKEEFDNFVKNAPASIAFLKSNFEQGKFRVYHGISGNERGPLVFQYRDERTKLLYLAHGLMGMRQCF